MLKDIVKITYLFINMFLRIDSEHEIAIVLLSKYAFLLFWTDSVAPILIFLNSWCFDFLSFWYIFGFHQLMALFYSYVISKWSIYHAKYILSVNISDLWKKILSHIWLRTNRILYKKQNNVTKFQNYFSIMHHISKKLNYSPSFAFTT